MHDDWKVLVLDISNNFTHADSYFDIVGIIKYLKPTTLH